MGYDEWSDGGKRRWLRKREEMRRDSVLSARERIAPSDTTCADRGVGVHLVFR